MIRNSKKIFLPIVVSLFFTTTDITAGELKDPAYWLDRMSTALRELNYQGTFVYLHDQKLEAMEIVHRVDADGERERLFSLNGAAREIVRDRDEVKC
ncbi:MAG: sigma-E factor regulatory protein RseB domain-containing protein, partial [Gammaproteobacteria bacterium]